MSTQMYFILFASFHFAYIAFLNKLKVCGNPALCNYSGSIFTAMFSHFVFLCHILVILSMFQTVFVIIMFIMICDQWSLILLLQHAEAQMMVNIFSNKVFFD